MCIFSWTRWSCGHLIKTRIDYCARSRNLTAAQRKYDMSCHAPSDLDQDNEDIPRPCDQCLLDTDICLDGVSLATLLVNSCTRSSDTLSLRDLQSQQDIEQQRNFIKNQRDELSHQLRGLYHRNA